MICHINRARHTKKCDHLNTCPQRTINFNILSPKRKKKSNYRSNVSPNSNIINKPAATIILSGKILRTCLLRLETRGECLKCIASTSTTVKTQPELLGKRMKVAPKHVLRLYPQFCFLWFQLLAVRYCTETSKNMLLTIFKCCALLPA